MPLGKLVDELLGFEKLLGFGFEELHSALVLLAEKGQGILVFGDFLVEF